MKYHIRDWDSCWRNIGVKCLVFKWLKWLMEDSKDLTRLAGNVILNIIFILKYKYIILKDIIYSLRSYINLFELCFFSKNIRYAHIFLKKTLKEKIRWWISTRMERERSWVRQVGVRSTARNVKLTNGTLRIFRLALALFWEREGLRPRGDLEQAGTGMTSLARSVREACGLGGHEQARGAERSESAQQHQGKGKRSAASPQRWILGVADSNLACWR